MKTGRAMLFTQRVVCRQVKYGFPQFATWEAFQNAFIPKSCLKNEAGLAIAKLEMEQYYQGKCSVDEYVDEFRQMIEQARYTFAIIVKFCQGLDKEIQDVIANIPIGRPPDDDADTGNKVAI
jgi:hypothetical protein